MRWGKRHAANIITGSRLMFLPLFILAAALNQSTLFVGLFILHSLVDILDGIVARQLHIQSDFGRQLDTIVDALVWIPGVLLFLWFLRDDLDTVFSAYPHLFIIPILTSLLMNLTAYAYLRRFAAIHLYTAKLTAALIFVLLMVMLLDKFYPLLGYVTAITGVLYHLEAMSIYFLRKAKTDENVTSLWEVVRQR